MKKLILIFVLLICNTSSFAQTINELVFFGDSLSDNGNLYKMTKFIPKSPPYYQGRFSNGPVWAEFLTTYYDKKYGVSSQNYSVGGATAVQRSIFGLPYYLKLEINDYLKSQSKTNKDSVLYFMWMGANDYMNEQKQDVNLLVKEVIDELVSQTKVLIENGGKNFVFINLPDISKSPYAKIISQEQKIRLKQLSIMHHEKLIATIQLLRKNYPEIHFAYIDEFFIFNDIILNTESYNQKYHKHIVNLTDACWLGGYTINKDTNNDLSDESIQNSISLSIASNVGKAYYMGATPCKNPDDYLFWDSVHPTVEAHEMFANIVIEMINREFNFR